MKAVRSWFTPSNEQVYVLDQLQPAISPTSAYGLLSNSKLRIIPSIDNDAFSDVSLLHHPGAERVTGVTCMPPNAAITADVGAIVWSCSENGIIAAWDVMRSPGSVASFGETRRAPFGCISVGLGGTLIAAGTDEGSESRIMFWDVRRLQEPLTIFDESHSDSITQLCFSPNGSTSMISGSVDGLVCAFDLSKPSESAALQSVMKPNSVCSHIGYFGANYEGIYATTRTETLSIFELESSETISAYDYDLVKGTGCRETLQELSKMEINYLIDCSWQPRLQKLILLAGNDEGNGFGFDVDLEGFKPLDNFAGGHRDVIRCGKIFEIPNKAIGLLTGGEDGRMCVWAI